MKEIHDDSVAIDYLNMQTGQMDSTEISPDELEPVFLMEATLYALGFRKTDNSFYGSPTDKCYIRKRSCQDDIVVIKTNQWHLLFHDDNCWTIDKQELYLHTLQNYLSKGNELADAVSREKFVELTNPYCNLPFESKEK